MRYVKKIRRYSALGLLSVLLGAIGISSAVAADTPSLYWERGIQQTVTLGGDLTNQVWSVALVGPGERLQFSRSGKNASGFYVYSVDIPRDYSLGEYEIIVTNGVEQKTVAYVTISRLVSYDLTKDPKTLGFLAVVLTTLTAAIGMGRPSMSTQDGYEAGDPDSPQTQGDEAKQDENKGSVEGLSSDGIESGFANRGVIDRLRLGSKSLTQTLDVFRHSLIQESATRSRAWMRIVADGAWLQALFGPLSAMTIAVAITSGFSMYWLHDFSSSVIPELSPAFYLLFVLGLLDSLAGVAGVLTFFGFVLATGNITSATDLRGIIGFSVLFFVPILIAGSLRPLRRNKFTHVWERLVDYCVAPTLAYWAVKGMCAAVDGFARQITEIGEHSHQLAVLASCVIFVRLVLEDITRAAAPARLGFLVSSRIPEIEDHNLYFALLFKACLYTFFMYGFFGYSWQGAAAIVMLLLPQVLKIHVDKFPNFPKLFQILPGGVPNIVFMGFIGIYFSAWINGLPLIGEDKAKNLVLLLGIPGFMLSLIKLVGRAPREDDVRWYRREKFVGLYRTGGVFMLALALSLSSGVIG